MEGVEKTQFHTKMLTKDEKHRSLFRDLYFYGLNKRHIKKERKKGREGGNKQQNKQKLSVTVASRRDVRLAGGIPSTAILG